MPVLNGSFYIQKNNQDFWLKIGTPGQTDGVWTRMGNIRDDGASGILSIQPVEQMGYLMSTPTVHRTRFIAATSVDFGMAMDGTIGPDDRVTRIRFLNPTDAMGFGLDASVKTSIFLHVTEALGFSESATVSRIRALTAAMGYGFDEAAEVDHTKFIADMAMGYSVAASVVRKRFLSATFSLGESESASVLRKHLLSASMDEGFSESVTVTIGGLTQLFIFVGLNNLTPSVVNTTFTFTASHGAAESNLYDGSTTTYAADPLGLRSTTQLTYDFGTARKISKVTVTTAADGGGADWDNTAAMTIYSGDTSLTSGLTSTGQSITIPGDTLAQHTVSQDISAGSHRFWQLKNDSGVTAGNAWLAEVTFQEDNRMQYGYAMTATLTLGGGNVPQIPTAVSTTFTFTGSNSAAEAHLYDNDDTTRAADPNGANSSTMAAYDLGTAKAITSVRLLTADVFGFTNSMTFKIQYSDTNLTTGWTDSGSTITANAGTSQQSITSGISVGSHRYWRIIYNSGTTGGNAWLNELSFRA